MGGRRFKQRARPGLFTRERRFRSGVPRVLTRSWADYQVLRMTEVPSVDVSLIERPEEKPVGAGESSQGPTVAAIANAVANATGRRIRDLPFTADRVKSALI